MERYIVLFTKEEERQATDNCIAFNTHWHLMLSGDNCFLIGDDSDNIKFEFFEQLNRLNLLVDDVYKFLEILFLDGSESQQISAFSRFLEANLKKNKYVYFFKYPNTP